MSNTPCRMCDRLVISSAVTFASGVLTINLPAGSYVNGETYCIVIAQSIPSTATINAPVVITIGNGTVLYPLVKRNCAQATACSLRTRTRYKVKVSTTSSGGSFRLMDNVCCAPSDALKSIDGTAPVSSG